MAKRPTLSVDDLDPFSQDRFRAAAAKLNRVGDECRRQAQALRAGLLALHLDDRELSLLDAIGMLTPNDHDLLAKAGRPVQPYPGVEPARSGPAMFTGLPS